jgi:two-component system response regulator FixJ
MRGEIVHILDDDGPVLKSLDRLVRTGGYQTRLYDTPFQLLAAPLGSGCLLLDIKMAGMDGLTVFRKLGPEIPVILMTGHGDIEVAVESLKAGAVDFLEKPFADDRLFEAIEAALRRRVSVPTHELARDAAERLSVLSSREREVLDCLVRGEGHKTIAHGLAISVRTVELHRAKMLHRLGTRHLAHAIKLAVFAELASDTADPPAVADRQ